MEKDLEASINLSGDGKGKNSAETLADARQTQTTSWTSLIYGRLKLRLQNG